MKNKKCTIIFFAKRKTTGLKKSKNSNNVPIHIVYNVLNISKRKSAIHNESVAGNQGSGPDPHAQRSVYRHDACSLGAEIIKVEPPINGKGTRRILEMDPNNNPGRLGVYFIAFNRKKRGSQRNRVQSDTVKKG